MVVNEWSLLWDEVIHWNGFKDNLFKDNLQRQPFFDVLAREPACREIVDFI